MRIVIRAKGFDLTDAARARVDRRVRVALSRFAGAFSAVTVHLEERGERAGFSCEVAMSPVRLAIAEEHQRSDVAIHRAIDRAARMAALAVLRSPLAPG